MFSFLVVAKYQYALARNFNFLTTAEKTVQKQQNIAFLSLKACGCHIS